MKKVLLIFIFGFTIILSSCASNKEFQYYSNRDNYVMATGIVTHMKYNDHKDALYLGFDELFPEFSDNAFEILGENLLIVQENGIDQKLELGSQVEFISAPRYFGDGYVMPIVSITIEGEVLLEFEEGYKNWIECIS